MNSLIDPHFRTRLKGLSPEQLAQVKALKPADCPRCYCHWWRPYTFAFELHPLEGCDVHKFFPRTEPAVCSRATGNPFDSDLAETQSPYLTNDGFTPHYFSAARAGKSFVYLGTSDFGGDPDDITRLIGLEPTKSWRVGEPLAPYSEHKLEQSGWRLYSRLPLSEPVEAHLEDLLLMLEPHALAVREAAVKFGLGIKAINQAHYMKKFHLSENLTGRIRGVGLSFEFQSRHTYVDQE